MRIGVFDSGLGGLLVLRALRRRLPRHDFMYLGDTLRVPYGNRSQAAIYAFTRQAVDYLFGEGCQLVILACNTASTYALRRLQREYLPRAYPSRRLLGTIIPTVEAAGEGARRIGILATGATVASGAYPREFKKLHPGTAVFQQPAPLLVPLIENGARAWAVPILSGYLSNILRRKIDTLVLGCTHYPALKREIRRQVGRGVRVVSQDELLPRKLADYLRRHPEIDRLLAKRSRLSLRVTDLTPSYERLAKRWFGLSANLKKAVLPDGSLGSS